MKNLGKRILLGAGKGQLSCLYTEQLCIVLAVFNLIHFCGGLEFFIVAFAGTELMEHGAKILKLT